MSFSSVTMRSATLGPTPGARAIVALSRIAMADARSAGLSVPSTESATLAPTPCTVCSRRNHSRSTSLRKPNSRIWSSRTWVSIDKRRRLAGRRQRLQRARRAVHQIADAIDVEDDEVLAVGVDHAFELADHRAYLVATATAAPAIRVPLVRLSSRIARGLRNSARARAAAMT